MRALNQAQESAVSHRDGPLLVIAGAGAGKTRTIVERIIRLNESGVEAKKILAVTFTNKAAREMLERIMKASQNPSDLPLVLTFHTLGALILRENTTSLGLKKHFSIADQDDSLALLKKSIKESGLDPKHFTPRQILKHISREKGRGVDLETYRETAIESFWANIIEPIWERYEHKLKERGALDFDDLLLWPVKLLKRVPTILESYRERWHYLLIDEYQDTNYIQYHLAKILTGPRQNICAVGDLDQSIYSWRGADCRHLLRFTEDYPGAIVITLEENYRSTPVILQAANQVISKNLNRVEKNLYTKREDSHKLELLVTANEHEEAETVAKKVIEWIGQGVKLEEIAILYRANFQSRAIEDAMLRANLPYRVLGVRFFDRREVKDVLAYLKAAFNPSDLESFHRALTNPSRGLGKVAITKILANQTETLPTKQLQAYRKFKRCLAEIVEQASKDKASQVIQTIIQNSGLKEQLANGDAEDRERLENIEELVTLAMRYDTESPPEGLERLLTDAALVSDQDSLDQKKGEAINLMTVHAAKGLEFDRVLIVGLEQDLFPHAPIFNDDGERDEEEERRLFYVALTRARDKLILSYAESRTIYGAARANQPSEFLSDIDPDLFESQIYVYDPLGG